MNRNNVQNGFITVFADASLYSKDAIFKCLYWYGDKFHVEVNTIDLAYCIILKPLEAANIKNEELDLYQQKLERDLIDFQLRDIISKETKNIRDLLVAKAFSNGDLDEVPPGEVSDPVGFSPEIVT